MIKLRDYQMDAIKRMNTGSILCGGVGSGKSLTSLAYYFMKFGGTIIDEFRPMDDHIAKDLYIITTARKRDTKEWEKELIPFCLSTNKDITIGNVKVTIDSWNNIKKYVEVKDAFFIFDEQRVVGSGAWVKSFLKITKVNDWILLSATPGDTWLDYIPVFVANGFYKNVTEFKREHVVYSRYSKFPKVDRYVGTRRLIRLRNKILVNMDYTRPSESHNIDVYVNYDQTKYREIMKFRWNQDKNKPIENAAELCYELRKCVNTDPSRQNAVLDIYSDRTKVIIFYNYDYELEILKNLPYWDCYGNSPEVAEWNGHKHQEIPDSKSWVYLVQYNAGAEGWNCIKTDTIIFYSQNYSYKVMVQSSGRIDRMNTPFKDLYYYHLKTRSSIDLSISKALKEKKKFNETKFIEG